MQIVIPMAGRGQRFRDAGYAVPKPLIPVAGLPMAVRAFRGLPAGDRCVFVCHSEDVVRHSIDRSLRQHVPSCQIVVSAQTTLGQACSARLAAEHLALDQPALVAACDNVHIFDSMRFQSLTNDPSVDALVWTYRGEPRVLVRPEMHGWVKTDGGLQVECVSVKKPVSDALLNDHVVSGAFWFRSAQLMIESIDALVAANGRVNGEFYLDSVPNLMIASGLRVLVFEVQKYIGWGTPQDVDDFCCWEQFFRGAFEAA